MKVNGIEIYNMETEFYTMQMEIVIKGNGNMVKWMGRESTSTKKTNQLLKENGRIVKRMDSDSLQSKIDTGIQVNGDKIKSKEKVHIYILMVRIMKEIGCKIENRVRDNTNTIMEMYIEASGRRIFAMVEELWFIQIRVLMKDSGIMEKDKEEAYLYLATDIATKVNGITINFMAEVL